MLWHDWIFLLLFIIYATRDVIKLPGCFRAYSMFLLQLLKIITFSIIQHILHLLQQNILSNLSSSLPCYSLAERLTLYVVFSIFQ